MPFIIALIVSIVIYSLTPVRGADLKILAPKHAEKSAQKQYDDIVKTLASPIETPIGKEPIKHKRK